ncbi:MAG: hypothetical protein P4L85_07035 [Paludisphaera borealis]|uniref:hypothetical protein n=1 Tax=Paludisphaera borealis TaxID=1387353 RepID=UPI002842F4DC|nr:hypothetical protein [Paludisphaera borealis]MDR3619089.1 hypothetical protein [Paludisphaera borealis]
MTARSRLRTLLAVVATLAAWPPAGGAEPRPALDAAAGWKIGEPTPLVVRDGSVTFRPPLNDPSAEVLVVVSSLARTPGPFPIRLEARSDDVAASPDRADDGPVRAPALAPFPGSPASAEASKIPVAERTFHMLVRDGDVGSASNYLAVKGVLQAVGRRVQVYVAAEDAAGVDRELLADLVTTFDDHIQPMAARSIGLAEDVDGDGRFTILLSSWLTRLGGGRHAVDGYVRVTDLDATYPTPFGNRCDMMYLSTSLRPGPHLRTVMAHEYTHAVVFTRKSLHGTGTDRSGPEEEGWLDEAAAHLCEDLHGFAKSNLDYRVSAFLSQPERYQLVVEDYYAADLFRSHGNRGGTYLFLRWCADRYGPDLLPTLIGSKLRGTANLEAATGRRFADLYRRWSVALYLSGLDPRGPGATGDFAGFRSVDVRAPLDEWTLAGPRCTRVVPDAAADSWDAVGTSSHYTLVRGGHGKAVEIRVDGPAAAQLQVTAMLMPRDAPRLSLTARSYVGGDGDVFLRATVREDNGRPVRLSTLAWEPLSPPPDPHRSGPLPGRLDESGVAAGFDGSALDAGAVKHSRPIRLSGVNAYSGPLVLKLIGVDAEGRRVAAWAELDHAGDSHRLGRPPLAGNP